MKSLPKTTKNEKNIEKKNYFVGKYFQIVFQNRIYFCPVYCKSKYSRVFTDVLFLQLSLGWSTLVAIFEDINCPFLHQTKVC